MEIRIQPRRSGVTTWLVDTAVKNAVQNDHSCNVFLFNSLMMLHHTWYNFIKEFERSVCHVDKIEYCVKFDNGSRIEFWNMTTFSSSVFHNRRRASDRIDKTKKFIAYADNIERLLGGERIFAHMDRSSMVCFEDIYVGGTVRGNMCFQKKIPFDKFYSSNANMLVRGFDVDSVLEEICRIVIDSIFKGEEHVELPLRKRECCKKCEVMIGNGCCANLGDVIMVSRKCPCFAEMFLESLQRQEAQA